MSLLDFTNQVLIDSLYLGTMRVKQRRETHGTILLFGVYNQEIEK